MKSIIKSDITAVILSGGQATRMNAQDKGLILFNDKPLISYVVDIIHQDVHSILVSANRNLDAYQKFGEVITDSFPGFQGPLAGILSALTKVKTKYLLVVPCDGPFINQTLVARLLENMQQADASICVAMQGQKMHPTFSLIRANLKDNLSEFLAQGKRKMGMWFKSNHAQEVDFSDQADMLINLNSPEDFKIRQ
ncbi:molybdopterin-guanine dinucleotide biosynthesis protein A [Isorropodon fossajaponicum endosymbiont JTNG4]|uniref:molybdenum cofactor guanylyltransferase MobA n=1 Tax=Isorropodon fossajaponicum symbiont TaxID=883811 RepID=UPI0019166CAF|nr:molybdenum cofactor guanylyltransferase MobA [Isorropodon fossajaponicum symbiont]BBB24155.1 molybdopterin-guanine dinucleotide biosynthesis protein A [Isorropodon fossajaponicum endosymbiont JTNG4]